MFAVRKGNPKNIQTWDDIVEDGVEVITPNPFTSGGAKWNLMAAYGSQIAAGQVRPRRRSSSCTRCSRTRRSRTSRRARRSQTFAGGKGDVLLAYENEAITAQKADIELDYVVPDETILIQNPAAVVNESENPEKAKAFVDWLATPRGAEDLRLQGLPLGAPRPGRQETYPTPKTLFKIDEFGGWDKVNDEFFDPEKGSVAKIERDLGVSTAG